MRYSNGKNFVPKRRFDLLNCNHLNKLEFVDCFGVKIYKN